MSFGLPANFERHCWLSLERAFFCIASSHTARNLVLLKTSQGHANKCRATLPECWEPSTSSVASLQDRPLGNRHTQLAGLLLPLAWWGHPCGLGRVNTHYPRPTFHIPSGVQTEKAAKGKEKKINPEKVWRGKNDAAASDELLEKAEVVQTRWPNVSAHSGFVDLIGWDGSLRVILRSHFIPNFF